MQRGGAGRLRDARSFRRVRRAGGGHRRAGGLACRAATSRRVVLARELSQASCGFVRRRPAHPRRRRRIHRVHPSSRIVETRDAGVPVVVVSTELDEVAALADRIAVMYRGRIVGIVPGDTPRDDARPDDGRRRPGRGRRMSGSVTEELSPDPSPLTGDSTARPGLQIARRRRAALRVAPHVPAASPRAMRIISVLAVVAGADRGRRCMIAVTDADVQAGIGLLLQPRPLDTARGGVQTPWAAPTSALFEGSIYNFGSDQSFARGIRPLTETLTFATPLIAAGLGVALAFRVGMFNIGGRGSDPHRRRPRRGGSAYSFDAPVRPAPRSSRCSRASSAGALLGRASRAC